MQWIHADFLQTHTYTHTHMPKSTIKKGEKKSSVDYKVKKKRDENEVVDALKNVGCG